MYGSTGGRSTSQASSNNDFPLSMETALLGNNNVRSGASSAKLVSSSTSRSRSRSRLLKQVSSYERYRKDPRVVLPSSTWMKRWDLIVFAALVWTGTGTVYDVCVLTVEDPMEILALNVLTIGLDLVFVIDTVLNCFRAYRTENGRGVLVVDLTRIQQHYLYSRAFFIDVLACIPFDVLVTLMAAVTASKHAHKLRFLRLLRLLRLGRLPRKIRQSAQWGALERTYDSGIVGLITLCSFMVLVNHWVACLWVLIGREEIEGNADNVDTWLHRLRVRQAETGDPVLDLSSNWNIYVISLYWSVTTLTSIGYGDVVPGTMVEYCIATFLMFIGSFLYTYIIGTVAGIVGVIQQNNLGRRRKLDAINRAMRFGEDDYDDDEDEVDRSLDKDLFRDFVHEQVHSREYKKLLAIEAVGDVLSPGLRRQLLSSYYEDTLRAAKLLRMLDPTGMNALVEVCRVRSFPIGEEIKSTDFVGVVLKGCATRLHSQRIVARGSVFGEEGFALLTLGREDIDALNRAMQPFTFFQVATVQYSDLFNLAEKYPSIGRHFKRHALRYALVRWAKSLKANRVLDTPGSSQMA